MFFRLGLVLLVQCVVGLPTYTNAVQAGVSAALRDTRNTASTLGKLQTVNVRSEFVGVSKKLGLGTLAAWSPKQVLHTKKMAESGFQTLETALGTNLKTINAHLGPKEPRSTALSASIVDVSKKVLVLSGVAGLVHLFREYRKGVLTYVDELNGGINISGAKVGFKPNLEDKKVLLNQN